MRAAVIITNNNKDLRMPRSFHPYHKKNVPSFKALFQPAMDSLADIPLLESRGNRPLKMDFEEHLRALVYYHLEEHSSCQHLLQVLKEDDFARDVIAPKDGISKSSFYEANNSRGLDQFAALFQQLQQKAANILPRKYPKWGNLISIDGSLIDAVLSMYWADYRKNYRKAKIHLGFDLNHGIPRKIFFTDGKGAERPFVSQIIEPGQTGVLDRGYQCHEYFDQWQEEDKFFVCRIKASTYKKIIKTNQVDPKSMVFYDATVLLGSPCINQSKIPLRLVGYKVGGIKYWIATNRFDLSAEQIAHIYKLRWDIEIFFSWWKRHLKVYHLIARSEHGLMVQIYAGLITYLLLAIYCHEQHGEKVTIARVRELRSKIINETRIYAHNEPNARDVKEHYNFQSYAKT